MARRTAVQMFPLVEQYEQGSWSKRAFCENKKVKEATFTYWLSKYRNRLEQGSGFVAIESVNQGNAGYGMEVELRNGMVLRFSVLVPMDYLEALLSVK